MFLIALVCLSAFVASLAGTALSRSLLRRLSIFDVPNERSSHTVVTPRAGGIAFAVVIAGGLGLLVPYWAAVLAGSAAVIALIGLVDDLKGLSAGIRLALQLACAGVVILVLDQALLQQLQQALQVNGRPLWWIPMLVALVLWLAGMTSAYNFMDGIDGIAAMQGIVFAVGLAIIAFTSDQPAWTMSGLLIASALAAFLVFNWSPATLFMGDVGSTFLGWLFGLLCILVPLQSDIPMVSLPVLLLPFLTDSGLTLMKRLLRGENVTLAHREHLYQRLAAASGSHAFTTSAYAVFSFIVLLPLSLLTSRIPAMQALFAGLAVVATVCCYIVGNRVVDHMTPSASERGLRGS